MSLFIYLKEISKVEASTLEITSQSHFVFEEINSVKSCENACNDSYKHCLQDHAGHCSEKLSQCLSNCY